jgi:MFS family permease
VFLAGLGWFTLASVLCAAAPGIGWLIAARAVQGIGGALMTPASLAIIEAAFQPADRTHAIGTWAGFSGVSAAIAPFVGGWLLEAGSWRAIFLINVPGRRGGRSQASGRSFAADAPLPSRPG